MNFEELVPAIALIAILILVLPSFFRLNSEKKLFIKNLCIWGVIIILLMIGLYFILK